jgi:hypothetical protein
VLQRLLIGRHIDFAALVSLPRGWEGLPTAEPLPNLTRAVVVDDSRPGAVLNACSSEVGRLVGLFDGSFHRCISHLTNCLPDQTQPNVTPNMATPQALVELLRHLKRAYWPFAWDTSVDTQHCSHGEAADRQNLCPPPITPYQNRF